MGLPFASAHQQSNVPARTNVIIAPHLGSATEQTRQRMGEISIENLLAGLSGKPMRFRVGGPGGGV